MNAIVRRLCLSIGLMLPSTVLAQSSPPPSPCPSNAPVDEVISEMNKQKPPRNKSLMPHDVCIWGWCPKSRIPTAKGKTEQQASTPPQQQDSNSSGYSTSKSESDRCLDAMERTLAAAKDVDVGDFNAKNKNYKGALMRYQLALEEKPDDAAIYVRLGRAYEALNDTPHAKESYSAAANLSGPEKWVNEAKDALARLDGQR
jgi:tetratricopeptide (TPR) repeat protein